MKLRELCSEFKYECLSGSMDVDVRDVIYDSRKITEGTVFVCMVGAVTDGHKYIPDAVKKGASAIVVERADEAQQIPDQITVIQVESARRALAYMSAALFGHPDRKHRKMPRRSPMNFTGCLRLWWKPDASMWLWRCPRRD